MEEFKDKVLTISYSASGTDKQIELLKKVIVLPANGFLEKSSEGFYMYGCRSKEMTQWPTDKIRSELEDQVTAFGNKLRESLALLITVQTYVDAIISENEKASKKKKS